MATKVMNGLDLQSQRIQGLADGSSATDAVTLQQLQAAIAGLAWKDSVRVATTTNGTLATAFANSQTVDGVTLVTGDRILLKNQSAGAENGIYTVAASGAPVRAIDANTGASLVQATVYVEAGTTQSDTAWTQTVNGPITLNTTALVFSQFGVGGTAYTAGNGLNLATTVFSVVANGTSLDVSASGVKIAPAAAGAGLVESSGILAVGAGTGITVNANDIALDTAIAVRKYAVAIGNGALTSIVVNHALGTRDITWQCYDAASFNDVIVDGVRTDANNLTLTFAVAPAASAYRVVVHG